MNLKKIIAILISIMMITIFIGMSSRTYATTLQEGKVVVYGALPLREDNEPHMGYSIDDGTIPLWNFVKYTSLDNKSYENGNIYCLKAGVGFRLEDESGNRQATYNVFYDMKKERDEIKAQNKMLEDLVTATITDEDGTTFNRYDALLAVLDMLYLPDSPTQEEDKEKLVNTIFKCVTDTRAPNYSDYAQYNALADYMQEPAYQITDNEISSVQQAVIWYFTNYYKVDETSTDYKETTEHETRYDKFNSNSWMYYTKDGKNYNALVNYTPNTPARLAEVRNAQVEVLYKYMINTAKEKANEYTNIDRVSGTPVRIDSGELDSKLSSDGKNRIIGPIKLTKVNPIPYTIALTIGAGDVTYTLLDENQKAVIVGTTIEDFVEKDQEFYIQVPADSITSNAEIKVNVNYNDRTMNLWASSTNNQEQPLAEVKQGEQQETKILTLKPEVKTFDLALRKYITKINNGPELSGAESRVPNINENSLTSGTTATYNHKKDPVIVEKGNIVTYKMTLYNEGQKAGRATKVVDQLPTGLKFVRVVSGNYEVESYNETTDNTLYLKRKEGKEENLPAYTAGNLSSETIEIECEVTANSDAENQKVLTNVAWIAEAYDAEAGTTIVNQPNADIDSEPGTKPTVDKDHIEDYKGNVTNPTDLSNSNYYYKGQQDDDDFEKLVLQPKTFDLALRKYITKINDEPELSGINTRVPNIDESSLTNGTTATYNHKKDPVIVEKGNRVTYKITIYNEGQKQGRATKIVDQLPTGLKFVRVVSGNFALDSYHENTDNTLSLKRIEGNQENLPAYVAGNLSSETIEIECEVTADTEAENQKVLTNVAWIAEAYDAEASTTIVNQQKADRDSEPGTTPNVNKDNMGDYKGNEENPADLSNSNYYYKGQQDDDDFEKLVLLPKTFDLALRKYIVKINDEPELSGANSRVPNVDESTLVRGMTATYNHKKDPVTIEKGDKVTYKMTIYNEGPKQGRATKIVDQLPTGLKFVRVVSGNFELESYNENTDNTLNLKRKEGNEENLPAYTAGNLSRETIEIECEVTANPDEKNNKILTNVAWIAEEFDAEKGETIINQQKADRDSEPGATPNVNKDNMEDYKGNNANPSDLGNSNYYYKGEQDDDDFEKLVLLPEAFDLKLIKRITEVNGQAVPERIEKVDVSKLNTLDANGNMITTADYQLNKNPVTVEKGDIVTYTFRIYNEGTIDGYADEITEDIPEGLQFLGSLVGDDMQPITDEDELAAIEFNATNGWSYVEGDTSKIKTTALALHPIVNNVPDPIAHTDNLIKAFGRNDGTKTESDLSYKEISVKFKVISEEIGVPIKNEAAITEDSDKEGNPVDDRDSHTNEWHEDPNHEDDEDHDFVILQSFDLALRKFIVAVSKDTKIENNEYLKNQDGSYKRAPEVDTSKLNTLDAEGNLITTAIYNHTKEPVLVQPNDIIVYMLKVYNEGDMNGRAAEIKDHLPSYLEFVEGEFNTQYGWNVSEDGRTVTTRNLENAVIEKAKKDENGKIVLSYKEVPIMCRVKANAKTNENITNIADITEYQDEKKQPVTDRDSESNNVKLPSDEKLPNYKDKETGNYVSGQQDDDDFEKVHIKIFDLALRKWVTQAIVIENGKETVTQTGHDAWDEPEAVVKVELNRKKIDQVTVKFRYSIRVYNQGEIAGFAKEVTDYIPEGLKFVAADNPGWKEEGNNVISTKLLENTLLQPGEYADVEVLLTWINNENNMGVMNNIAEISQDYNEYGVPDIDSTPDNQKQGEDDIDDAPVMLSITTGQVRIYFTLGFIVLITMAGGVVLIKKFVL